MKKVKLRDLSRQQRRQYDDDRETVAEELVAEEFGLLHVPDRAEWYDAVNDNTGAKSEVKSTSERIGEEYPADGRFRVWESQTRSLVASDAQGVAWVAFVLFDEDAGHAYIQRRKPSTVLSIVNERGGWNESGHSEFGRQYKLPIEPIFSR